MSLISIKVGKLTFTAKMLLDLAPVTCAEFLKILPLKQKIVQARWSGESAWIPLGALKLNVGPENQTYQPSPGELLFYPGGLSETEILFPYGKTIFACKAGQLSGNSFLTLIQGQENLPTLEQLVLWEGAQDIIFEVCEKSPL